MVTRSRRCSAEAKACGVHDLIHEFCVRKAKEENFMMQIREDDDMSPFIFYHYRLNNHLDLDDINQIKLYWRRGFYVVWTSSSLHRQSRIKTQPLWIFDRFKLFRVLNLSNIRVNYPELCLRLESLFHLRYLALEVFGFEKIPSSLLNLETLFVVHSNSYGLSARVSLPQTIWCMVHLRHVKISPVLYLDNYGLEDLENLQSIGTVEIKYCEDDVKNILKRFPNLQKLMCSADDKYC